LPLVVEAARAVRLEEVVAAQLSVAKRERGFSEMEKLEALLLLVAGGGDRIEDIRILAEDQGLLQLLDRELPSPDALLDFLRGFDDPQVWAQRPEDEKSWVPPESAPLVGLGEVNRELVARGADRQTTTATIDHDGTIIEAHKREAVVAYEGTRGYQPLVAVWVEQDLLVADEFRDGNVPGNKDPLTSVRRAFAALPAWVDKRYFRGDSADYYVPLLKYLVKEQITFSISADMSAELRAVCVAVPTEHWVELAAREREVVHVAEVEFTPGDWPNGRAAALCRDADHPAAARAVRGAWPEVLGGGEQSSGAGGCRGPPRRRAERSGSGALALGEGRHHRARAPEYEGRAGRRGTAQPAVRRERGVVPHHRDRL
jgi:hypothetical protein